LAATGKLARAIAKARIRAEARKTGRNFSALAKESGFTDLGDDSDDDGPAGGQAETSIAVDSTGQHIVIGINDTRGFSLSPVSVSGFAYSDNGGVTFTMVASFPRPALGSDRSRPIPSAEPAIHKSLAIGSQIHRWQHLHLLFHMRQDDHQSQPGEKSCPDDVRSPLNR